jgi:putative ABC transport system permease protein
MFRQLSSAVPLAVRAILQWPLRAALTAFGILIGVAAVVITVALGEGTEIAVQRKLNNLGENTLTVTPQDDAVSGAGREGFQPRLTETDGEAIHREARSVTHVAPVVTSRQDISFGGFKVTAEIIGTTAAFTAIRSWGVSSGELWSEHSEQTASRVCLLGHKVRAELFGEGDAVGRILRIGRHPFRVVGVLEEKGPGAFGQEQDNVVLTPVGTARSKFAPTSPGRVNQLLVKAKDAQSIESARQEMTLVLRQRHGLWEGAENDFSIRTQDAFRETQDRVVGVLRLLLTSIAGISLLVGGIGIMNIMLVSVTERTRDIGIRMAIGATRWDILFSFLVESVLLSLGGGLLGTALAVVGTFSIGQALSLPLEPSAEALSTALGVSTAIGVVFGIVPSWRAASLDPIIALGRQ